MALLDKDNVVDALIAARDGAPAEVPFNLLQEWSDDFSFSIGRGSFGDVFHGVYSDSTGTKVGLLAIKRANPRALITSEVSITEVQRDLLNSVRREILVLSRIRHPNVIKLLGYSIKTDMGGGVGGDHNLCLVYELADKGGLDDHLTDEDKAKTLDWKRRISVAVGAAAALSYFHNNPDGKTYHRDVKSANFVLFGDFTVKLIDCGLSKYIPSAGGSAGSNTIFSRTGQMYGTPGYMCLQYSNTGEYDAKSEIYSFGVVLAELLSGTRSGTVIDGQRFFYNDQRDIHKDLKPDVRAGSWPPDVVGVWRTLLASCLCHRKDRVGSINTLLRQLKELENLHCPSAVLSDEVSRLRAQLDAFRISDRLDERRRIEAQRCCVQCGDEVEGTLGIACINGHFICDECFPSTVLHQVSFEEMETFKGDERSCRICCAYCLDPRILVPPSDAPRRLCFYVDRDIAVHAGESAGLYFKTREDVLEGRVTDRVATEVERKVRADIEMEREAEKGRETRVTKHRKACEELLDLNCPGCEVKVDMGFEACLALNCLTCTNEFCAWCFQLFRRTQYGERTHVACLTHVKECRLNPHQGDFYLGGGQEIISHTNRRVAPLRQQRLIDYIRTNVEQSDRADLLEALPGVLQGFHINIDDIAVAVAAGGGRGGGGGGGGGGRPVAVQAAANGVVSDEILRLIQSHGLGSVSLDLDLDITAGFLAQVNPAVHANGGAFLLDQLRAVVMRGVEGRGENHDEALARFNRVFAGQQMMGFGQPVRAPMMGFGQPVRAPMMGLGQPVPAPMMGLGQPVRAPMMGYGQPVPAPMMGLGQPVRAGAVHAAANGVANDDIIPQHVARPRIAQAGGCRECGTLGNIYGLKWRVPGGYGGNICSTCYATEDKWRMQ